MLKYQKGQKIFTQGAASDAVFYIQKGKVQITVLSQQGKEAVIAVLGPDDFFGEGCLTGQVYRLASITDSQILRIGKTAMIDNHPHRAGIFRRCSSLTS